MSDSQNGQKITAAELTGAHVGHLISLNGKNKSQILEGPLASVKFERSIQYTGNDVKPGELEVVIEVVFGHGTMRVELPRWAEVYVPA